MKKVTLCAMVCLFLIFQAKAQSIDREILAATGISTQNNDISMSWTLGELAVGQFQNGSITVSEGFHQGEDGGVPIDDLLSVFGQIQVFPNPTTQLLQIEREYTAQPLYIQLTDMQGKVLLNRDSRDLTTILDLSRLASGFYLLRLSDASQHTQTYQIQKH